MWISSALWASMSLALWSGKWDGRLQIAAEVRAGQGPLAANQDPRAGVATLAMPGAVLRWLERDIQFRLEYGARGYWRYPNELGTKRPLLLHLGRATLISKPGPHLQITGQSQASVGEADYSALPSIFSGPQASLPSVMSVLALSAGLGVVWDPSRRSRLELTADAERRQTLGDTPAQPDPNAPLTGFVLPKQTTFRGSMALGGRPTTIDLAGLALVGAFAKYDSYPVVGVSLMTVAPQVYWRRRLSLQTEVKLAGGAFVSHRSGQPVNATFETDPWSVSPAFTLQVESHVARHEGQTWDVGGGISGESFLDPVLAIVTPRAVAQLHAYWRAPPRWMAGLEAFFIAPMRGEPLPGYPDETAFGMALPLRYRVSSHWTWEWGVRWSDRAPHWDAPMFRFHQRQFWVYTSILAETLNLFE